METTEESTIDWSQSVTYDSGPFRGFEGEPYNPMTTTEQPAPTQGKPLQIESDKIIIGLLVVIIALLIIRIIQDR